MNIFQHTNYRDFLQKELDSKASGRHGQLTKIAKALDIHPSIVTLVLQNKKDFTLDQASDLCVFFGFSDLESDYFLCLVQIERAARPSYRERLQRQLKELRKKSENLKERMPAKFELTESDRAIFYSQWYFSGIRILCSLQEPQTLNSICDKLNLPLEIVKPTVDFLVSKKLCNVTDNKLTMGPQSTHIESTSQLVSRHHINWRLKAIEKIPQKNSRDFSFTSPVSISIEDYEKIRAMLEDCINQCFKVIDPSPAEKTAFLNIDWMQF